MKIFRITGKSDGIDYGNYEADDEVAAVKKMLDEAGADEEPKMENWIVEEETDN